jgi:hypothetical protein
MRAQIRMPALHVFAQEIFSARIRSQPPPHLQTESKFTRFGERHMTKIASFAIAFVLFAPVAVVTLMQAAQIVA